MVSEAAALVDGSADALQQASQTIMDAANDVAQDAMEGFLSGTGKLT